MCFDAIIQGSTIPLLSKNRDNLLDTSLLLPHFQQTIITFYRQQDKQTHEEKSRFNDHFGQFITNE
jgi:hypothetical protein